MSNETCQGDDGFGSPPKNVKPGGDKKKNRKLSWQETPKINDFDSILLDEIKLEEKSGNGEALDQPSHGSISDGELVRKQKEEKMRTKERRRGLKRRKSIEVANSKSASFGRSHRRVKSLIRFEPNEYTLGEIRELHERMSTRLSKPFKPRAWFFTNFSKQQNMLLVCLCLVDFASFCSMSVMAPFFPKEHLQPSFCVSPSRSCFLLTQVRTAKPETKLVLERYTPKHGTLALHGGVFLREKIFIIYFFYALVVFLSSPVLGKMLPLVGARFLFLAGLFLNSTCDFLFGLLGYIKMDLEFAVFCFLVEGLGALGASAYCTATYVFIAEIFPSNIGSVSGLMETFVGLGMSIGPALGGFFYHVGGFGLPFYVLGTFLFCTLPIAFWFLPVIEGGPSKKLSGSFLDIITEPSVIVIGLVIVVTANVWAFLDPTLEPHLRQFNLTPEKIGFVFLLFSALYGLSSPLWGFISDKTDNHWFMMTSGLFLCTIGLLLLGPAPFIPGLPSELWLTLVALAVLGVSVSLSLLPTFQGLLSSIALAKGNSQYDLSIYGIVAGMWSCFYALGEVIGPLIGGLITEHYGFPICCTVMAAATFTLCIGSFTYFIVRDCLSDRGENYRYKFEDSDGYESDCSDYSDGLSKPILPNNCHNRLYTENDPV